MHDSISIVIVLALKVRTQAKFIFSAPMLRSTQKQEQPH